jgi:phenylalanyl-tRNA synthetase beta chain
MKLSEKWLREWVDPRLSREALIHTLTMAGLSVESCDLFENSLDEYILEFELTPNRGDCLSVLGIAREISALTNMSFETQPHSQSQMQNKNIPVKINIQSPERCPYYAGRVISNISENASAPDYIQLRLKQSGIKLIHPVVDVMNYVMLEIGQPLHAFDWKIFDSHAEKEVIIRHAKKGETLVLLDNKTLALQADTLVIADKNQAHAMAGIMGGLASSVTQNTRAIFIESAFFTPEAIRGRARRYGLSTDASQRFERGVDPLLPRKALERATELLSQIYSNLIIADIIEKSSTEYFPHSIQIVLRPARVEKLLGLKLSSEQIQAILLKLNITVIRDQAENFLCTPPVCTAMIICLPIVTYLR